MVCVCDNPSLALICQQMCKGSFQNHVVGGQREGEEEREMEIERGNLRVQEGAWYI